MTRNANLWRVGDGLAILPRPDPTSEAALALETWFEERLAQNPAPLAREDIHALFVLLEFRYFFLRRKATEDQHGPLHDAFEACFERLEVRWHDTDPPLLRPVPVAVVEEEPDDGVQL